MFSIDPSEKQVGDEIISLLQQGRKFDNCNDSNELESFHQAATKLGITSSRAAWTALTTTFGAVSQNRQLQLHIELQELKKHGCVS